MGSIFFNAHHAPIGAFASFTLGFPGPKGGLGLELGRPAERSIFVGLENAAGDGFELLPFSNIADDERKRYDPDSQHVVPETLVEAWPLGAVSREFGLSSDTWRAGDLTFCILSPVRPLPDPAQESESAALRDALLPAVFVELTIDNRAYHRPRRACFGYEGTELTSAMRSLQDSDPQLVGIAQGQSTAIVALDQGPFAAQGLSIGAILGAQHPINWRTGLGTCAALLVDVPAGTLATYRFAVCFHRAEPATTGIEARYFYTRFFPTLAAVATYANEHSERLLAACRDDDTRFAKANLSADQRFMLNHAIRSYYGSSQLLDHNGPLWVVNEGEYRMINTFDLVVDQLFFELRMHPWAVRNILDQYAARYSYDDEVRLPGSLTTYPGGISFTHDMGVANNFSRPGYSSYEQAGLTGCFSYMSSEQLVNYVLCATTYSAATGDAAWLAGQVHLLERCLHSMLQRDHPLAAQRDGVMDADGARCAGGSEITTYDSLDPSLGQARRNLYLALKSWSAYLLLEQLFAGHGLPELAQLAGEQARRCAATICRAVLPNGELPALLEGEHPSRIIPAIEGLIFPWIIGKRELLEPQGPYGELIAVLRKHLDAVLVPGVCLFADGGWKLSSTSDNSWLSKIYLCQFVARQILGVDGERVTANADAAHVAWLTHPEQSYWCWSDQIIAGVIQGSKYYPRGVTAILWLEEYM
jgi:xylan 1,4-beta-xylosidase